MKTPLFHQISIPCSTWNVRIDQLFAFLVLFLVGCEQRDPKPELKDKIYQDMLAQQGEADRIMKEMEAKIVEVKKAGDGARIHTGMKEKAERQAIEFGKTRDKMAQQISYWKIRSFERLKYVRSLAGKKNEPYLPDPMEWDKYQSEKRLRQAKNAWDLKDRFKETGFDYNPVLMGEEPGSKPKEKQKPAEGGGHH